LVQIKFSLKKINFIGYDYGNIYEYDVYASIFEEILFGHSHELVVFKNKLNECFLFSSVELAEEYVKIHHKLLLEGEDVETGDVMEIYEIWKANLI
jgi:hypothetical protein